jgi:hypothetical protein
MSDLALTTGFPQDTDTERLLLARLARSGGLRFRSTSLTTALASAARTATTASADISAAGARGVLAVIQTTTTDATLNLNLGVAFLISGQPYAICSSGNFAVASTLFRVLILHPELTTAGSAIAGYTWTGNTCEGAVADTFRLVVAHSSANTITYSVGYILLD